MHLPLSNIFGVLKFPDMGGTVDAGPDPTYEEKIGHANNFM